MSDHHATHAPIVILMTNGTAAAREFRSVGDQRIVVTIFVTLSTHEASARRQRGIESPARGSHGNLRR